MFAFSFENDNAVVQDKMNTNYLLSSNYFFTLSLRNCIIITTNS